MSAGADFDTPFFVIWGDIIPARLRRTLTTPFST